MLRIERKTIMKKSWMLILVGALWTVGGLALSAQAQSNLVYATEYNQTTNRFGTIDLVGGNFARISSYGTALINDVAYCPTNGMVYAISNSSALVTFNKTNGAIARVANFSVSGIQSLAFRPSDGTLFGATHTRLYTINPASGKATSVGTYGSPSNLNNMGQNIRFAQDGNLYVSNTSTNTDIYRINTSSGAATWMGQAVGYPYLMLQNSGTNMYSVFINLGSASNQPPMLVTFDLNSFVAGGTNANGSPHQITVKLVGAGTNFPANFNFSGALTSQPVTNLTVPVSATGPSNQTVAAGGTAVFSTVASGTGPYTYAWLKNGTAIGGKTNSSLTLNNVTTADAATYSVIVGGAIGTVTNSATLTVGKATAAVTLGSLNQTYDGAAKAATATTTPSGLAVTFTYNGSANAPTNAGSYTVIGSVNDANYQGSATNTLVIAQATGSITLGNLNQTYDGSAKGATAITTPIGLAVNFTYNGSATVPTAAGSYTVVATVNNANYQGSASGTLVISKATSSIALGSLSQTYDGAAKAATATTTPSGLAVSFTYNGSVTVPTAAGTYTVVGTINDANYQGSATGSLVIDKATSSITLGSLSQTYDGAAKAATATTTPSGLAVNFTYNGSATIPTTAGTYTVVGTINDANYQGSASGSLVIDKATSSIALGSLNQTYDGAAKAATATTTPSGLAVSFTYNGSATIPTTAGTYTVVGTINDANYQGSATGSLVIEKATSSIALGSLSQTYDGAAKAATAATTPSGLAVNFTYDGSATVPTAAGTYTVVGTINDANYQGSASGSLVIEKASSSIALGSLNQTYDGSAKAATATTTPSGLVVTFTYNGSATVPTAAGTYTVVGTINDANYEGSATGSLVVDKATSAIAFGGLNLTYSGTAKPVTVTTTPNGLTVDFTYNGSATVPVNAGTYAVVGTISDANYQGSATGTLVIKKAVLTITAAPNTKTYDGTTSAAAIPTVNGLQGSDSVTGLSESYDNQNVGTGKTLSVSAYTVNDSNNGNNYTVNTVTGAAGIINPAPLTITASANVKTYDGTTSAAATPTVSGLQGADSATGLSETYDNRNAGTGKTLNVSAYTVNDGNAGNNYTVNAVANTQGVINPAPLTIAVTPNTKTYDGTTSATAIPTVSGLQDSDSISGLVEAYDTKDAGIGKTLRVNAYTINDGNAGNNYNVNTSGNTNLVAKNMADMVGVIIPASLTITANNKARIYGSPNPTLTASYSGFVNGENAGALMSPVVLNTTATTTSEPGKYPITASGAATANYSISYIEGTLTVASTPQLVGTKASVNETEQYVVSYPTVAGLTYQLEYTTDLLSGWTPLGTPFPGNDGVVAVTNSMAGNPNCFFRVQVVEEQ
jgi:hypothetical protein